MELDNYIAVNLYLELKDVIDAELDEDLENQLRFELHVML